MTSRPATPAALPSTIGNVPLPDLQKLSANLARAVASLAFTRLLPFPARLRLAARLLRFYQQSGAARLLGKILPRRLSEMSAMLPAVPEPLPKLQFRLMTG